MSTPKLVALGLSIALVGGAVLMLGPSPSTTPRASQATAPPKAPDPARTARSHSPRTDPNVELAELRHQVRILTEAAERAEPEQDLDAAVDPTPEDAPTTVTEVDPREVVAALDTHLHDEAYDSAATNQASAHVGELLAASGSGELLSLDCGQTLCRSTLGFEDTDQRDARLADIGSLMPWDADGFFNADPDDELRVSVYFTRDAMPLPTTG